MTTPPSAKAPVVMSPVMAQPKHNKSTTFKSVLPQGMMSPFKHPGGDLYPASDASLSPNSVAMLQDALNYVPAAKAKATAKAELKAKPKAKPQHKPPKTQVDLTDLPAVSRKVRRERCTSSAYHKARRH